MTENASTTNADWANVWVVGELTTEINHRFQVGKALHTIIEEKSKILSEEKEQTLKYCSNSVRLSNHLGILALQVSERRIGAILEQQSARLMMSTTRRSMQRRLAGPINAVDF